ncbi:unnamed protein product, partial [Polarella glacialis]
EKVDHLLQTTRWKRLGDRSTVKVFAIPRLTRAASAPSRRHADVNSGLSGLSGAEVDSLAARRGGKATILPSAEVGGRGSLMQQQIPEEREADVKAAAGDSKARDDSAHAKRAAAYAAAPAAAPAAAVPDKADKKQAARREATSRKR